MIKSIDTTRCNTCGVCADVCPMDVLRIDGDTPLITYPVDCMTCFNCETECPTGAIYVDATRAREAVLPW